MKWSVRLPNGKYVHGFNSHLDALKYARKVSGTPVKDDGLR